MANIITVQEDGFVDLEEFKNVIDTSKVVFYSIKLKKDNTLLLKFYDKKKKLVKPYGSK